MKSIYAASVIAGFITGIPAMIVGIFIFEFYRGLSLSELLQFLPFTATIHIGMNVFWGLIFGLLFAKFYDVIPGDSGVRKGLVWGLIYAIVPEWWCGSYNLAYGQFDMALTWAIYGPIVIIFFGLPLGYLYEGVQKPVRSGDRRKFIPIAGIVSGLIGGIVVAVLIFVGLIMGMPYIWHLLMHALNATPLITNVIVIEFILMFVWGIIFSVLFALLYARIPGKGIRKGICWGLILLLITVIYGNTVWLTGSAHIVGFNQALSMYIIAYCLAFISYGLVLGYFYKK